MDVGESSMAHLQLYLRYNRIRVSCEDHILVCFLCVVCQTCDFSSVCGSLSWAEVTPSKRVTNTRMKFYTIVSNFRSLCNSLFAYTFDLYTEEFFLFSKILKRYVINTSVKCVRTVEI